MGSEKSDEADIKYGRQNALNLTYLEENEECEEENEAEKVKPAGEGDTKNCSSNGQKQGQRFLNMSKTTLAPDSNTIDLADEKIIDVSPAKAARKDPVSHKYR